MEKKTNIGKGNVKKREMFWKDNFKVIIIALLLIVVVLLLWWLGSGHFVWIPLETSFEAGS